MKKEKDTPEHDASNQDEDMDTSQPGVPNGVEDIDIVTEDSEDPAAATKKPVTREEQKDHTKGHREEPKSHTKGHRDEDKSPAHSKGQKEKDASCSKCASDCKSHEGEETLSSHVRLESSVRKANSSGGSPTLLENFVRKAHGSGGSPARSENSVRKASGSGSSPARSENSVRKTSGSGGSSSKHPTREEINKARRMRAHKSPWCRSTRRRRRRHHSTPNYDHPHPHHLDEEGEEEEEMSEEEEAAHRLSLRSRSGHHHHYGDHEWEERRQQEERRRREHSPVSAANPANVNVSGRTRRSLDHAPPVSPVPPPPPPPTAAPPPAQQPAPQQVCHCYRIKTNRKHDLVLPCLPSTTTTTSYRCSPCPAACAITGLLLFQCLSFA